MHDPSHQQIHVFDASLGVAAYDVYTVDNMCMTPMLLDWSKPPVAQQCHPYAHNVTQAVDPILNQMSHHPQTNVTSRPKMIVTAADSLCC